MITGNERGSKKIATIIATSIVAIVVLVFAYALFVPANSPIMLIFNKNRYNTEEKQKDAVVFYESEQWEKARDALVESIALKPQEPLSHYMLGVSYAHLGEPAKAIKEFQTSLKLKDDFDKAMGSLASIYFRYGEENAELLEYQKARDYFRMANVQIEQALKRDKDNKDYLAIQKQIREAEIKIP